MQKSFLLAQEAFLIVSKKVFFDTMTDFIGITKIPPVITTGGIH